MSEASSEVKLISPPHTAVDITPNKDGGILKEILKPAISEDHPLSGDHVAINYDAMFADGSRFDSSHFQGDRKFEFILGKGSVVKAWDIAVATMKASEKSRFYCRDSYVYADDTVDKKGYIIYDIELLQWQGADVSKQKDGGIRKSILVPGEGRDTPNDGATCEVHIIGTYNDCVFEDRDVTFVYGEGIESDVVPGVEIALRKFHRGERSRLNVKAVYGYGIEGNKTFNIPPDADLIYDVHMKNFIRVKDFWQMNSEELLASADQFKERGTMYFKQGKYNLSRHLYKKVVQYLTSESGATTSSDSVRTLLLTGHLNLAMAYLKLSKDRQARESCDSALALDADNVKALYRRGMANLGLQCLEEARHDFNAVLKLEPGNKAAQQQLAATIKKQSDVAAHERSLFAGMFQKFAKKDSINDKSDSDDVFTNVGEWSNDLASGMMTLEQEMAAFGEKMPEPKYNKHCGAGKENERPDSDDDDDDDD